jgi:signal transduction histidine kinase
VNLIRITRNLGRSLPKAMVNDLEIVQRNCEHLTSMINDVLALSQADSGKLVLNREYVDLREIIEQAFEVVSPLVNKKKLETRYSAPESLSMIYCDRTRIRQVLLNLVSNSARFTEQVACGYRRPGQCVSGEHSRHRFGNICGRCRTDLDHSRELPANPGEIKAEPAWA